MILPGFNDEALVKRFSKRLRKILLERGVTNVPSLTQMHEAVAQGIGHPSWFAAEQAWAAKAGNSETKTDAVPSGLDDKNRDMSDDSSDAVFKLTPEEQARLSQALATLPFPNPEDGILGWRVFRFAAVLPTHDKMACADIHVAIVPNSWRRHGLSEFQIKDKVDEAVRAAGLEGKTFKIHEHEWSRWPIAWKDTILGESNAFPLLVLFKRADGSYDGALMARTMVGDAEEHLKKARSATRANNLVEDLKELVRFDDHHGWFKQTNFEASNLQDLISRVPKSHAGQFCAWIFEDDHWKTGMYHLSDGDNLSLHSKTKPASHKPLKGNELLSVVRANQTVKGDWKALEESIGLLAFNDRDFEDFSTEDFEGRESVQRLCAWWNTLAPEGAKEAGCFRFYVWKPKTRTFDPIGEAQEPELTEDALKKYTASDDYTLFEQPGKPTVLVQFLRGRKHNRYIDLGTQVYQANGKLFWEVGAAPEGINEAHVSVMGLAELQDGLRSQWQGWNT